VKNEADVKENETVTVNIRKLETKGTIYRVRND